MKPTTRRKGNVAVRKAIRMPVNTAFIPSLWTLLKYANSGILPT
jgi:hypothetical protein